MGSKGKRKNNKKKEPVKCMGKQVIGSFFAVRIC